MTSFLKPNWPCPSNVSCVVTTRQGGVSAAPWDSFNLATHVDDHLDDVLSNRARLSALAHLPANPEWLNQTHSIDVIDLDKSSRREGDAAMTRQKNKVAAVLTADCLPLLVANKQGTEVAAIHAGWKGLLDGIVIKTIQSMNTNPKDLLVWLGPAISQANFEVGAEIRQQFCDTYEHADKHFLEKPNNKFMADLYGLARDQLSKFGVKDVFGGEFCSYQQQNQFYSYRRDGVTGRMASLIWINNTMRPLHNS